jgi:hypothetical protein
MILSVMTEGETRIKMVAFEEVLGPYDILDLYLLGIK